MTARGASTRVLNILQQQISVLTRIQTSPSTVTTFSQTAAVSIPRRRIAEYHVGLERNIYGGSFPFRRLHSDIQARTDNHETHEYEKEKMTSEGGGTFKTFEEKARELKSTSKHGTQSLTEEGSETAGRVKDKLADTAENATEKASRVVNQDKHKVSDAVSSATETAESDAGSVVGTVKEQVSKEAETAKDMFKDFPEKMSETAAGVSDVGKEAAKAVKRDASKVAQKIGLK